MRSAITKGFCGMLPLLVITFGSLTACRTQPHGVVAAPATSVSVPVAPATTTPAPSPKPAKPKVSKAALDYFFTVALGTGAANKTSVVNLWTDEVVTVGVHGFTNAGRRCLSKTISDFNALTRTTDLRVADGPGDIEIYIAPITKFHSLDPSYEYASDDVAYFSTHWGDDHQMTDATVLIRSDGTTASERCRLIRGELTESMGLSEESAKHPSSIFYSEFSDAPAQYSALDKAIIRLMYDGAIEPGDDRKTVTSKVIVD
jgi:hypothetical protein